MEIVLAGDIGGTNARFVLFRDGQYDESSLQKLPVDSHPDLADTIQQYLHGREPVSKIALSVASTAESVSYTHLTLPTIYSV